MATTMISDASSFSHEEHILVAPFETNLSRYGTVRLETASFLRQQKDRNTTTTTTTPFPLVIRKLLHEFGVSSLLLQTGSISSTFHRPENVLEDNMSMGPSGVAVTAELKDPSRFLPLLRALVGHRLLLAPLNAISLKRLHRHIHETVLDNRTKVQVVLPMEGAPVAMEHNFFPLGIFADNKALSHILLGDSKKVVLSHKNRRSMWTELTYQNNDFGIRHGLQYTVMLSDDTVSLSQLVPFPLTTRSPLSSNATVSVVSENTKEWKDWNESQVLQFPNAPIQWTADRTILRPHGVANTGRLITRIEARELECLTQLRVVEVFPSYIAPQWDTWTLQQRPLISLHANGSIVAEWNVTLAPNQVFEVSLDYEPTLLPFQHFPADPNRGMEVPPTQFYFDATCAPPKVLYSSPLLLMPPVPDMSMPFNVISLTCTLYAFVIGSLVNLLVRKTSKWAKDQLHPEQREKSKLEKLKDRLFRAKKKKKD